MIYSLRMLNSKLVRDITVRCEKICSLGSVSQGNSQINRSIIALRNLHNNRPLIRLERALKLRSAFNDFSISNLDSDGMIASLSKNQR